MPVNWTITLPNGDERTLKEWAIGGVTRTLVNQAPDTVDLQFLSLDISQAMPWRDMDQLTIKRNGLVWFVGNVLAPSRAASGSSERVTTRLVGPWWWLNEIVYRQPRVFVTDADALPELPFPVTVNGMVQTLTADQTEANAAALADPANYPHKTVWSSIITLSEDNAGALEDTRAVILRVLDYAISKGAPLQIGTISPGIQWPRQEVRDMMCGEVLRRMLRCTPDQVAWFDYTTSPATLNITNRAGRASLTIAAPDDCPSQINFTARTDLVAKGVTLNFLKRHERTGLVFYTLDQDKAGDVDALGAVENTFELQGGSMMDQAGNVITTGEPVPTGLAAQLLSSYQQLYYDGELTVVVDDCAGSTAMNRLLNVTGVNPEWQSMNAVIQSQIDTLPGTTQYRCGPPEHLGASDLLTLMRAQRGLTQATDTMQTRITGSTPAPVPTPERSGGISPTSPGDRGDDELPPGAYDPYLISSAFSEIKHFAGAAGYRQDYPPESVTDFAARGLSPTPIDVGSFPTVTSGDLSASLGNTSFVGYGILTYGVYGYDIRNASGYYTTAVLNLTGLAIVPASRIFLVGTKTLSTGSGTATVTTQAVRDISEYLTTPGAKFTLNAAYGATATNNADASVGGKSIYRSGSITYTEIRVYAPAPIG